MRPFVHFPTTDNQTSEWETTYTRPNAVPPDFWAPAPLPDFSGQSAGDWEVLAEAAQIDYAVDLRDLERPETLTEIDPNAIRLTPVRSSNIAAVGWSSETLVVEFVNGEKWAYHGVALGIYEAMLEAPSIGQFFHRHIRGHYAGEEL